MAGPSDHELIAEIQSGRRDALGILFDRYSPQLYEFIYLLIGDRDQAARLLEQVFTRVPAALAGLGEHESVRGWLYGLAREVSLAYLRQKNWLEALPPSDEPVVSGLPGDIWRAARAMPAFHRAVLVVEELHGLSPTEKARALNVARTDMPRLVEEARRSFNFQFDVQARQQGRPLSAQVDPERIWGVHRRLTNGVSLFGYLPVVVLPDSLAAAVRAKILSAMRMPPPPQEGTPIIIAEETETMEEELPPVEALPPPPAPSLLPEGCSVPVIITALVIALVITALAACVGFFLIRDSTPPAITRIDPPDKANVPPTSSATLTHVIITAAYQDDRAVDPKSVRLILDGREVTAQTLITDASLTYPADLEPGTHVALLELRDTSGNRTSRAWQFATLPSPEATATLTPTPTLTPAPIPTAGPSFTPTPTPSITPLAAPVINAFSANQTSVKAGTPVLLTWAVTGADIVFLNQDKVDPTGTRLVSPTTTTTYHLIANNASGTTDRAITITVEALPDLIVLDVSVTPAGQVTYTIRNTGTGPVTQMFLIQVFVDGIPIDSNRRVSSLPAGQDVSLFVPNYVLLGTHVVTVRLNSQAEVPESNTTNNELTRTIVGPTPTPTSTATPTATNTATSTPTATSVPTNTPTATATNTPTATPTVLVTGASVIRLSPTSPYTGTCPITVNFSGTFTTTAPTTVVFQWERAGGGIVGPFSAPPGTNSVLDQWTLNTPGTYGDILRILQPNTMISNQASFVLSACQ
ncbi:MAG: hypothetical protein HY782_07690 [Chloroflexi bacterium]|nr:hypothetical protein [Chloroflexota bacterium]